MKTRCPACSTGFRVTPAQLKARAGKVRCGKCDTVFNALDCLIDETPAVPWVKKAAPSAIDAPPVEEKGDARAIWADQKHSPEKALTPPASTPLPLNPLADVSQPAPPSSPSLASSPERSAAPPPPSGENFSTSLSPSLAPRVEWPTPPLPIEDEALTRGALEPIAPTEAPLGLNPRVSPIASAEAPPPLNPEEAQALGKATGMIAIRDMTEIPGYSKWTEGLMSPSGGLYDKQRVTWPFTVSIIFLSCLLAFQALFYFRQEIALKWPSTRPTLLSLSRSLGYDLPWPRVLDAVSIESSELQADKLNELFILNVTLRNHAKHPVAYPLLELSLMDSQNQVIARRILSPADYISPEDPRVEAFPTGDAFSFRLWIEVKEMMAAGYRLYLFYP